MRRVRLVFAIFVSAVLLTDAPEVRAEVSFAGIPAATDVASSRSTLEQRIARVLGYWSAQPSVAFPNRPESRLFTQVAAAKLAAGREADVINRALSSARPYAAYGTRITIIPGLCARRGDYDFMAQELVRIAYTSPLALWPATARRIAWQLLPEAGARHPRTFWLGLCGRHRETENHFLMTEASRYLTNQLRRKLGDGSKSHDNARNGNDGWMMRHLGTFLRGHFEEYNARPYQGYTVDALTNLHSFAEAPGVARAAGMVLDYLSAVFAVQSNGLRRHGPLRRQARYANTPITYDHDTEAARFALLAGNTQYLAPFAGKAPYGSHFMLSAALGSYRVPDTILDLMVRKDQGPYYQRFQHDGDELCASSPSYLISAGGVFTRHFAFGSAEQHGWARATTVLPSGDPGSDTRAFVRIEGTRAPDQRNNTCVAPNFACGVNVVLPATCRVREGDFEFVDFTRCGAKLGFYAAARIEKLGAGQNFGAVELREAAELPFASFRASVLRNNRGQPFRSDGLSHYVTSDGHQYAFEVLAERTLWPLVAIDGVAQLRSFARWPLAEGDIVHAAGDGLVMVDNPFRGERLMLDARDAVHPKRSLEKLQLPTTPAVARR
ncbi:MAG TPA: hypothetical protein VFX59_25425 [Polyangiales bacterium]|nr:hypothetical protein [Polyangiales bacterium]